MNILGAGFAGLIAGCVFQNATIFEKNKEGENNHKALLRFRTPAIGDSIGVDFRKVKVHKGIYDGGKFVKPDIRLSNNYSKKVIGRIEDRSIWNIDTVDRYVAPENIMEILIERCEKRITWDFEVSKNDFPFSDNNSSPIISTIPMPVIAKILGIKIEGVSFKSESIFVKRWKIRNCNVHQTIYYPDPNKSLYRASITGDTLIAEYTRNPNSNDADFLILDSFGLYFSELEQVYCGEQIFGKIAPIDGLKRKTFIHSLSRDFNTFSLGRFGTWRNILLDDILNDLSVIKKLINCNLYDISRINAG